jgi:trehalose 6-phosphate phosphatase
MRHAIRCLAALNEYTADSERLLVATDFDGTLCPLADSPSSVVVRMAMMEILNQLVQSDRVKLAVVSGRALTDLAARIPLPVILAGNHGFEIRAPGLEFEHPEARRLRPQLATAQQQIRHAIAHIPGAWVEDKGLTATIHYRGVTASSQAAVVLAVRKCIGQFGATFSMGAGKKAIEVYPRCGWNKGAALSWIRQRLDLQDCPCICIGDDRTDESMFAVNAGLNIRVGQTDRTIAQYWLADNVEVMDVLAHLAHTMRSARPNAALESAAG